MNRILFLVIIGCIFQITVNAQQEKRWIKHHIALLASPSMHGRGYVGDGKEKAAKYIVRRFREFGLRAVTPDSVYTQDYNFGVNTFPNVVYIGINKKELTPGEDFLVDANSSSFDAKRIKIKTIDFDDIHDTADWTRAKAKLRPEKFAYFFKNMDSFFKHTHDHPWGFVRDLNKGCYILPQHGKIMWTVGTRQMPATVLYVEDTVLPKKIKKASVHINAKYLPPAKNLNKNIIGCVPGEVKDSFVVFSAHYDHLGMMGSDAIFPGASDNASGTAMMLYLANYFAQHPQHYTMVFIAFSGEEAGLLGSDYFVKHPLIPLSNIKFVANIDIMGDAQDGITVVNATEYPKQFELLQRLNKKKNYLSQIKSRGKTSNSDHYHFSANGVPAFFFYSNGGPGFYHDVFDTPASLPMTNIDRAAKLFVEFGEALNKDPNISAL